MNRRNGKLTGAMTMEGCENLTESMEMYICIPFTLVGKSKI